MSAPPDLVVPAFLHTPDRYTTLGLEVAGVCELVGFPPDPEQRLLLDAAFAVDKRGRSTAFEVAVVAPRQNLKTGFFKQYALGQLFVREEPLVVWSAHEFDTAAEALKDIEALIEASSWLTRRVKRILHAPIPTVELMTGVRLKFKTRTSGGGRGLSGRKVILDEAFALSAAQVGALMPIMLAQPDPQLCYGSSACRPESSVLWDVVQRGRLGVDPRLFYAEWCAPAPEVACDIGTACDHARGRAGCGCDKPDLIVLAHSAVTRARIQLDTILDMRRTLPPEEYGREVMGWHDEVIEANGDPAVDIQRWEQATDRSSTVESVDGFGLDASPDGVFVSIGLTGLRPDGRRHVEHVERRRGFLGLVERCVQLNEKHGPVPFALEAKGGLKDLILPLREAGLDVRLAAAEDGPTAAKGLVEDLNDGQLVHGPQPELDDAVRAARWRSVGDGISTFGRRRSASDISALYAVTFAHWVAVRLSYDPLESIL